MSHSEFRELRSMEHLNVNLRLFFPKISALIKKNNFYIFRREDGSRYAEPTESIAKTVRQSMAMLKECMEPHRQVLSLLREDSSLNQYLEEIDELPSFIEALAVMLLVKRVDLTDFDNDRWWRGGECPFFGNFLDSFKLQYCRLRISSNQKQFIQKV